MNKSKFTVYLLSVSHMLNDWYMNFIQTLLPFLVLAGLPVSKGAFLVSAFTLTSSVIQPFFGAFVDRKNQRWLVYVGTAWMAVLLGLLGVVKNYPLMLVIVSLAGLGTAAFHPQASAMVSAASGSRKGFYQAMFIAWGNVGWALTPVIVSPLVYSFGLEITPFFMLPGILVAVILLAAARQASDPAGGRAPAAAQAGDAPRAYGISGAAAVEIFKIMSVVMTRSMTYFGMVSFLPLYLQAMNYPVLLASKLLFVMLFTGALGGIVGGYVSDLIGRKAVICSSLLSATVFFYLFTQSGGAVGYVLLALAGASLMASFSVTVVAAQEILTGSAAMAAGLMLGFGIGMGGLGVGLMGLVAEKWGMERVIEILVFLPAVAGIIGLSLKKKVAQKMPATGSK